MDSYSERKKKVFENRKRLMIKNWLASFMVTTVAIVAVVILAPLNPSAEFLAAEVFGTDIYYDVMVTDDSQTITAGSLKIVAETATEYHEIPLEVGRQTGNFATLFPNTEYRVSVKASYGFGEGTLAKSTLVTAADYGGRITGWEMIPPDPLMQYEMVSYQVTTSYNDLKNKITEVNLKFAYLYQEELPTDGTDPVILEYNTIPITEFNQTSLLEFIPDMNVRVYLVLEAVLVSTETVILDQLHFDTPMRLYASLYVSDVGPNYVMASIYPDFSFRTDIVYTVELVRNGEVLQTQDVVYEGAGQSMEQETIIRFEGLLTASKYHLRLVAKYVDLDTGQGITEELYFLDVWTTMDYELTISGTRSETIYFVELTLDDSNAVLSGFTYYVYELVGTQEIYYSYGSITMQTGMDNLQHGTSEIVISLGTAYKIEIYATKTIDPQTSFPWCLVGELTG